MNTESVKDAARKRLDVFVGKWDLDIRFPDGKPWPPSWTSFEWHPEAPLLVQRTHAGLPEAPDAVAIIGCDGMSDAYTMLYTDERDVQRIYEMSIVDRVWKFWRIGAPFSQRYEGTISEDGHSIVGRIEKSDDGKTWELDFHWSFVKVR